LLDFGALFFPVWLDSEVGFLELLAFAIVCVRVYDKEMVGESRRGLQ
jgi:hypothetical protein